MRSVREYVQWALGAARIWRLNDGEARMLAAIAAHVNENGECTAGNERLAVLADRHRDTGRKLLRRLRRIGLIETAWNGRSRVLRLRTDRLPVEQLELDLARIEAGEGATDTRTDVPGRQHPGTSVPVGAQAPTKRSLKG